MLILCKNVLFERSDVFKGVVQLSPRVLHPLRIALFRYEGGRAQIDTNETVVEVLTTTGGCLDLDAFAVTFLAICIARCSPSCRDHR